jgi:hypothetical protein
MHFPSAFLPGDDDNNRLTVSRGTNNKKFENRCARNWQPSPKAAKASCTPSAIHCSTTHRTQSFNQTTDTFFSERKSRK